MTPLVTRFAPSPTGLAHLGNFRTAYFNWLAARATGGTFILRIDDTDLNRNDDTAVKIIYDTMNWLGLDYNDTFKQSDNAHRYRYMADLLRLNRYAYTDSDSPAVKLKLPSDLPASWHDELAGDVVITDDDLKLIDGLVLIKSDGNPTYNFATVVDDVNYGINYVIRGTDHIANTAKQVAIRCALAKVDMFSLPDVKYAHVGLIFKDNKKLSKRDGAASLLDYRDTGINPNAMLNFMLRLGWSPSDANFDQKVKLIDRNMAVDMFFKDGSMRNSPANMDVSKLDWYNRRY